MYPILIRLHPERGGAELIFKVRPWTLALTFTVAAAAAARESLISTSEGLGS